MPDASVWEDIRRAYDDHRIPIRVIVETYGITAGELTAHRQRNGWPARPDAVAARLARKRPATAPAAAVDVSPPTSATRDPATPASKKATPIAQRRALVQRLTNAIETKLKLLERRFAREMEGTGKGVSAADFERDTRAIGLLIKNLEQVTEYDHGQQAGKRISGAAAKSATVAATALSDEADRLRRELGERLQRLVGSTQDPA